MMNMKTFGLTSAILLSAVSAFAAESDAETMVQQKSLLEKLDSINSAVLGLKLNGTAKAGVLTSMSSSDQFSDNSPTQETQAFTDVNLVLTARPSSESQIHIEMRLHKDWQSAYDENNNPVIGHWFSYDGLILDKHLAFNLGYMRVGYTPLTLFTPQPEYLQEPEIFTEKRVEALAKRNLDTTSRRLLQGLNADFHSGEVGAFDDIHVQATGARLRNAPKKNDQMFFDFDWSDRYMYGGRLGAEAFGAHLGANYVDVFDRKLNTRSRDMELSDTIYFDDNWVASAEVGFDSKKLLADLPVTFGLFGEFAYSNWEASRDYMGKKTSKDAYQILEGVVANDTMLYMKKVQLEGARERVNEKYGDDNGTSFYVEPYVKLEDLAGINATLKFRYLQNDEKFWSDLASSPTYRSNTVVLNANSIFVDGSYNSLLSGFGASNLENMYFTVYNSNPLTKETILNSGASTVLSDNSESGYTDSRLYNNYKNAHVYRNAYSANTLKRMEASSAVMLLDPTVNLALPFGIATPDRKGFAVSLDADWNDAVSVNGRFSQYNQDEISNTYTQFAGGLGVNVGRLIGLDQDIVVQGSYDHAEEDAWLKRKTDRIIAGATIDVWGPIALLAGYQTMTKEFGNMLWVSESAAITKAEESLLLVGPRVKIAPLSYISVQYGMLTDKVSFTNPETAAAGELSIDKNVIVADVTVNF